MSLSANQRYLNVYRASVDTTPYFNKVDAPKWNPLRYTLLFVRYALKRIRVVPTAGQA